MFILCNFYLYYFTKEEPVKKSNSKNEILDAYRTIFALLSMPQMKKLLAVLLICKIGYIASDSVAGLKLLEAGFKKEQLAITVLIDFPFQLIFGYYAAKWSSGTRPLRPWM
jgi:PAT family acetyl-CoA transporter-like MFS transporter 1